MTYNIIPDDIVLRGTVRTFQAAVQELAAATIRRICDGIATMFDITVDLSLTAGYPATVCL